MNTFLTIIFILLLQSMVIVLYLLAISLANLIKKYQISKNKHFKLANLINVITNLIIFVLIFKASSIVNDKIAGLNTFASIALIIYLFVTINLDFYVINWLMQHSLGRMYLKNAK